MKATFELSHINSGYYVEMVNGKEEIQLQYYSTAKDAIERAEAVARMVWGVEIMEVEA